MHMPGFRAALSNFEVDCPKEEQHYCLVCGLKQLHDDYSLLEFSGGGVVDVDKYRFALAELYAPKEKFQMEKTADAMEALGAILHSLHAKASGDPTLGLDEGFTNHSCSPPCPSHQAFALELLEQLKCRCGATSEPLPWDFSSFLLQVYVTDLISNLLPTSVTSTPKHTLSSLSTSTSEAATPGVVRVIGKLAEAFNEANVGFTQARRVVEECPDNCPLKRSVREMQLMSAAEGFILNLVWSEEHPKAEEIVTALALLPSRMSLSRLFSTSNRYASERLQYSYRLRGFISYGFVHYVSFFLSPEDGLWWKYDDEAVRQVGNYARLLAHMLEARMHPVGVLYEKEGKEAALRAAGEAVPEIEWRMLERKAREMDIEDAKENAEWECPACGKNNARGRMVCEVCFSLPKGQTGWGCTRCSSRNDEFARLCKTCYEFRRYICKVCHHEGTDPSCAKCREVLCTKCRIRRAADAGLCVTCRADSVEPEEGTRKSIKQSDILSQSAPSSLCPKCRTSMTSGECAKCAKDTEEMNRPSPELPSSSTSMLRQSATLTLASTKCITCNRDKTQCQCARWSQETRPPLTTFCKKCCKISSMCVCPLPGKIACICGKLPDNCVCGQCKVCYARPGECECKPTVPASRTDLVLCTRCSSYQCRCHYSKTVISKPLGPDKLCILCQRPIPKEKYCSRCYSLYRGPDKKCYSCMSYFKGFICVVCKNKARLV